jgi:hypothetical protein
MNQLLSFPNSYNNGFYDNSIFDESSYKNCEIVKENKNRINTTTEAFFQNEGERKRGVKTDVKKYELLMHAQCR